MNHELTSLLPLKVDLRHPIRPIKIGEVCLPNNLVLAPMAGVTDGPFRLVCQQLGAGMTVSELASSNAIVRNNTRTLEMLKFQADRTDEEKFEGTRPPFAAQIFGSNPDTMAEAARIIDENGTCDIIDINMGCPVPKVVKTGAGSALMKNLPLAEKIVQKVVGATNRPVTIKIRLGWNDSSLNFKDFVRMGVNCGVCAIAIHARTREAGYSGKARWKALEGLSDICEGVPLIANGDISRFEDIEKLAEISGCTGFMIGRGAIGYPWVFPELLRPGFNPDSLFRFKVMRRHLVEMLIEYGPRAVPMFRVHLFNYLRDHPDAAVLRRRLSMERDPNVVINLAGRFYSGER